MRLDLHPPIHSRRSETGPSRPRPRRPALSVAALRFREVQSFRENRFAWLGGIGAIAGILGVCVPAGLGFGPDLASLVLVGVMGLVGFLLLFGELRVEVRDDALYARLFPLTRQHRFAWSEIRSCGARTYRPILEYGGWGVRYGRGGKAYNVSGNQGVQLEFHDGGRLLIGSRQAEQLAASIREMCPRP